MHRLTITQDKRKKWRWKLRARNGVTIDSSTQGFSSEQTCRKNIHLTFIGLLHSRNNIVIE